jgi:hypothetical protein
MTGAINEGEFKPDPVDCPECCDGADIVCRDCCEQRRDAGIEALDGHETRAGVYTILSAWEGQNHE